MNNYFNSNNLNNLCDFINLPNLENERNSYHGISDESINSPSSNNLSSNNQSCINASINGSILSSDQNDLSTKLSKNLTTNSFLNNVNSNLNSQFNLDQNNFENINQFNNQITSSTYLNNLSYEPLNSNYSNYDNRYSSDSPFIQTNNHHSIDYNQQQDLIINDTSKIATTSQIYSPYSQNVNQKDPNHLTYHSSINQQLNSSIVNHNYTHHYLNSNHLNSTSNNQFNHQSSSFSLTGDEHSNYSNNILPNHNRDIVKQESLHNLYDCYEERSSSQENRENLDQKEMRRKKSNQRERDRVSKINHRFDDLRNTIKKVEGSDTAKLSKLVVLEKTFNIITSYEEKVEQKLRNQNLQ